MPPVLFWILVLIAVVYWVVLVRGIALGKLGRQGVGFIYRVENPTGFWSYAARMLMMALGFTAVLVVIAVMQRDQLFR